MNFPGITGTQFLIGLVVLATFVLCLILIIRYRFLSSGRDLPQKYQECSRRLRRGSPAGGKFDERYAGEVDSRKTTGKACECLF